MNGMERFLVDGSDIQNLRKLSSRHMQDTARAPPNRRIYNPDLFIPDILQAAKGQQAASQYKIQSIHHFFLSCYYVPAAARGG